MSKLKIWSFTCGFAITQKKSEIVFNTICHFNNNCCYYLNVYSINLQTYGGFCKRKSNVNEIFLPTLRTKFNLNTAWDAFFVNPQFLFPNNINKITNKFYFYNIAKSWSLRRSCVLWATTWSPWKSQRRRSVLKVANINQITYVSTCLNIYILIPVYFSTYKNSLKQQQWI